MDRLQHLIDLRGMGRVVVRLDAFALDAEPPRVSSQSPRVTIARVVDGEWRWQFDALTHQADVRVNGMRIVSKSPVADGDVVEYARQDGRSWFEAIARFDLARGALDVIMCDIRGRAPKADSWLAWRETAPFDLATTTTKRAGGWALFRGPGDRTRAVARRGTRTPHFVVRADVAFDRVIVDELPEHGFVVLERGGVATLEEIVDRCVEHKRFFPPLLAADLVLRAHHASGGRFDPARCWVGADGFVVTFLGPQHDESPAIMRTLIGLLGASREPAIDAMNAKWAREFVVRFFDTGPQWWPSSIDAVLEQYCQPPPERAEAGALVAELFRGRVDAEEKLARDLASLDDDAFARFVEGR